MVVEMFRWSLREIDETDMESLLQFVTYYPHWKSKQGPGGPKKVYADQVDWV